MEPLKIGIIGFGKSAEIFHAPFIANNPDYIFTAVLERNSERSKYKYPQVKLVKHIDALMQQNIDVVVITTPNTTHYEYAKISLLNNKHIIIEKPFTITTAEADDLINIARGNDLMLTVYHNRRWDGDFMTVKAMINNGVLGKILEFESRFDRYRPKLKTGSWKEEPLPGNGILYDLGSHLIDQCVILFGFPESINADISSRRESSRIDDYFKLTLKYKDLSCILTAGMMVRQPELRFRIKGSKGNYIKNGLDPQENDLIEGMNPSARNWGAESEENYGTLISESDGIPSEKKIKTIPGNYREFYKNIYRVIRLKEELIVKPKEARDVIRIIELSYESSAKKQYIPFKI